MTDSEHEDLDRLIRDSRWMRGLARRLVRDADVANDVLQDAWIVAIEQRARVRGGMSNFLAGVIKRLASGARRSTERRERREAATPPRESGDGDVAELAARLEAQREVAAFLLALAEPYRATLLLRYVEDWKPAAIASRQGVPVATVNSRLARGLALLRDRLDRSHGGREPWVRTLSPFVVPHSVFGTLTIGVTMMSMQQKLAALAAALVLCAGATWWVGSREDSEEDETRSIVEAPVLEDESPEPLVVAATQDHPRERRVVPPPTSAQSVDPPPAGRILRVIAAEDRAPIADAIVGVARHDGDMVEVDAFAQYHALAGVNSSIDDVMLASPSTLRTDEHGIVKVPVDSTLDLFIAAGNRSGTFEIRAGSAPVDVAIAVADTVNVTVRDAAGVPVAGVPVGIVSRSPNSPQAIPLVGLVTGHDGRVALPLSLNPDIAREKARDLVATLLIPLSERVERIVRRSGDEVELVIPPTASLECRVRDAAGNDVDDGALVLLGRPDESGRFSSEFVGAIVRDGRAEFPFVGPGLELVAKVHRRGASPSGARVSASPDATVHSPARTGERGFFEIVLPTTRPITLRGRMVDPSGDPWRGEMFVWTREGAEPFAVNSDSRGRFRTVIDRTEETRDSLRFTVAPLQPNTGKSPTQVEFALESRSEIDVGDVAVHGAPVLAAGAVRDTAGSAVRDARIVLVAKDDSQPGGWRSVGYTGRLPRTDEKGRFEFRGAEFEPNGFLAVTRNGSIEGEPVPCRPSRDLLIIVPAFGAIRGRVVLDAGLWADRFTPWAWNEAHGVAVLGVGPHWKGARLESDGSFCIPDLDAGSYTVVFRCSIFDSAPWRVSGVVVGSGDTHDPRLAAVDLRGRYHVLDLDVDDASGDAVSAKAFLYADGVRRMQLGDTSRSLVWPSYLAATELVIEAEGYGSALIERPTSLGPKARIVLEKGLEVVIGWPATESLPTSPVFAVARLVPKDLDSNSPAERTRRESFENGPNRAPFGADRSARLRVPAPGDYALEVFLELRRDGSVDRAWVIEPRTPQVVSVVGPGAEFNVNAPAAAFEAARAKIESKH